jgi:hypothetical protein
MAALARWGVWKRAGMTGEICGLDLAEALQSIPDEVDLSFVTRLFAVAEPSFIRAIHAKSSESA